MTYKKKRVRNRTRGGMMGMLTKAKGALSMGKDALSNNMLSSGLKGVTSQKTSQISEVGNEKPITEQTKEPTKETTNPLLNGKSNTNESEENKPSNEKGTKVSCFETFQKNKPMNYISFFIFLQIYIKK
jgi:hypothetical protein